MTLQRLLTWLMRMQHLSFVQHLAGVDEDSADWTTLGLLFRALMLIDARANGDVRGSATAASRLVMDARAAYDGDPIIERVIAVAELLTCTEQDRSSTQVSSELLALAALLRRRCLYEIARDVARSALRQAPINSDDEWIAHREWGCAEWSLGNLELAADHYNACIEIGQQRRRSEAVFWGHNGQCLLVMERGNLPQAEKLYRRLSDWGRRIGRADIESHARHGLGITLALRGRLHEGLEHLELALPASTPTERNRVLSNIAYMRLQLGEHDRARDMFLEIARVACDLYESNAAHVNLIEVYAAAGNREAVDTHRRYLEDQRLASPLAVDLQMTLGRAYLKLGDRASAAPCFRLASALAQRAGLGRSIIEADQELERVAEALDERNDSTAVLTVARESHAPAVERFSVRLQQ